ncbi:MAG TPA: hypothetical protein VFA70_00555 [Dehalococcoidia bacterium]|nr:hypothetical protein [Dehalococcoidia bacterium]
MASSRKAQGGAALLAAALGLALAVNATFGYVLSRTPTHGQLYYAALRDHGHLVVYAAGLPAVKVTCKRG